MTTLMSPRPRFLLVSFDGLRPDLISSEQTPNIARLQRMGVTLSRHRTVYPSETRVAFPSLVTGATSNRHGMVGNKYVDRLAVPNRYVDTADAQLLRHIDVESGGQLMTAPTLGEILAGGGKSLAVLATNTPGTTRFFHHKAEDVGHPRLSGHFPEACTPERFLAAVEARFGRLPPAPPQGEPDIEAQDLITSAFLDIVWPQFKPDVTILSYGEPDTTSHFHGTGAPATRQVLAHCDAQFGRVLDWWEAEGYAEGVQLAVLSDHGHITAHSRVSVADSLRDAGLAAGIAPGPGIDVVVVPGQVGALYLADRSQAGLARLVEAVIDQPWCGPVFAAPRNEVEGLAQGTLGSHLVFADHERAPDVYFVFRSDDGIDPFGLVGGTFYDNARRPGLGVHGGLHPKELAAVGIVAGSAFLGDGVVSSIPSGICDIAPTVLHLMGLAVPPSMTGRVLVEALAGLPSASRFPTIETETFEAGHRAYRQSLRRIRVGTTTYLDAGWGGLDRVSTAAPLKAAR